MIPRDKFKLTEQTVARLLVDLTHVSVRQVSDHSVYLKNGTARENLHKLVAMGWLTARRGTYVGVCYYPTDLGRMGFASLVDIPLRNDDA